MAKNQVKATRVAIYLGDELKAWLRVFAKEQGRSMSSEIIQILKREKNRVQPSKHYSGLEPF